MITFLVLKGLLLHQGSFPTPVPKKHVLNNPYFPLINTHACASLRRRSKVSISRLSLFAIGTQTIWVQNIPLLGGHCGGNTNYGRKNGQTAGVNAKCFNRHMTKCFVNKGVSPQEIELGTSKSRNSKMFCLKFSVASALFT